MMWRILVHVVFASSLTVLRCKRNSLKMVVMTVLTWDTVLHYYRVYDACTWVNHILAMNFSHAGIWGRPLLAGAQAWLVPVSGLSCKGLRQTTQPLHCSLPPRLPWFDWNRKGIPPAKLPQEILWIVPGWREMQVWWVLRLCTRGDWTSNFNTDLRRRDERSSLSYSTKASNLWVCSPSQRSRACVPPRNSFTSADSSATAVTELWYSIDFLGSGCASTFKDEALACVEGHGSSGSLQPPTGRGPATLHLFADSRAKCRRSQPETLGLLSSYAKYLRSAENEAVQWADHQVAIRTIGDSRHWVLYSSEQ